MDDAASFDAIMQCNLLEVFCEALGAAIVVTDKRDEISFASIRLLHLFPIRESAIAAGGRARDLYAALYDAGIRFCSGDRQAAASREEWIAERIACAWKERVDKIEQTGPDRWIRVVSRRFSSGLGFVVMQDVSEQKKKEDLLRAEQERVRVTEDILDTLPVAVAVKDRNLDYIAVNQEFCRLIGTTQETILGRGSWDAFSPELAGRIEQLDWQLLSSGEPNIAHVTHTRPDGVTFALERRSRRLGKPGSHYIAVTLTERPQSDVAPADVVAEAHFDASAQPKATARPQASPVRNVLYLTVTPRPSEALKLALRAHGADLCCLHDLQELAAFLPAARDAGIAIDLVLVEFGFDAAAFELIASSGLIFRLLPEAAEESAAFAEILDALPDEDARAAAAAVRTLGHVPPETERTFPAEPAPLPGAPPRHDTPPALDVLAVEDNPINRMVLEQVLASLEVSFRIVATAAEAIAASAAFAPLVVLSDTTLPDRDIADLALELRRIDPARPLVALIPSDSRENHALAERAGFDCCLAKPLSAEALGALLSDRFSLGTSPGGRGMLRHDLQPAV